MVIINDQNILDLLSEIKDSLYHQLILQVRD